MQYVYVLESVKDKQMYVGCTNDLRKRLLLHNSGKVVSTSKRFPLKLIYYETFINKHDGFAREKFLKTGWGRNYLKKVLFNYNESKKIGG